MYGEKIEENEELRLDLLDVKEMYKAQIDHLMKTWNPTSRNSTNHFLFGYLLFVPFVRMTMAIAFQALLQKKNVYRNNENRTDFSPW